MSSSDIPCRQGPATSSRGERGNQITDYLARRIFSGELLPGDVAPKETELADTFAISRASVRSGLAPLAALGIIQRQAGRGTTVQEYSEWTILDPAVTGWMVDYAAPNPAFLREIFEFRRTTEPLVAAMAASRAKACDTVAIEEAFDAMARHCDDERSGERDSAFTLADIDFHSAIYRATHNLVWAQLAHILRPSILLVIRQSNDTADELRDSLERHRTLMDSIRLRNPEAAFDAALRVMNRTGHDLGLSSPPGDDDVLARLRARISPSSP
ncbi:MAG: GntR family transcriptional regulator [Rhodospirillaceae bacterium BRH_c57]|nr:MAG: GntR family transcriptional regulator [Rhodospirillaceae bacterium BRH_c57]